MSFHLSAEDISLEDGHVLKARLANTDGEHVDAELDLNYYIGNSDGSFEWGGENFAESAEDISFELEGDDSSPILRATLNNMEGEGVSCDLNLSERIGNDNGVLIFLA
ncbi:CVNH domain-containing protein [Dactylonectria estremocensis]|uniref:CVNH domain-containing protein n=1 Tax=Dactylonectria estremocensis TaxID=1079267 RepID=A0A9P9DGY4_9HYPO|nr:CVNH domain-containing protein [Dactylonectria estremocensis]